MKSIRKLVHAQLAGFLKAGKEVRQPQGSLDRGGSKLFGLLLIALGAAIAVVPLWLDYLPGRLYLRAQFTALAAFAFGVRFLRGISVVWMLRGLFRYWLPTTLLIYIYFLAGLGLAMVFGRVGDDNIGIYGGVLMLTLSICAGLASWEEARLRVAGDSGEGRFRDLSAAAKTGVIALRFYALVWLGFFVGGFVMLAWATGLGDWFFQDVLGW